MLQRSVGTVAVEVVARDGGTGLRRAYQSGSGRLRFPRAAGVEAMVLNTSGGLAGGDRFDLAATAAGGTLTISTQASERVYRGEGVPAVVSQSLTVSGGALHHLPQPTILFDGAALRRRTTVAAASGTRLVFVEGLVLGRVARGETVGTLDVVDRTEVRIDGRLAFVDALRLDARALAAAEEPAGLRGARALGLVLSLGVDDATLRLREALPEWSGAGQVGALTVARLLAPTHTALQDGLARAVQALGAHPPRAWAL